VAGSPPTAPQQPARARPGSAPLAGEAASAQAPGHDDSPGISYQFTRWGREHTVHLASSHHSDGSLAYQLLPSTDLVGQRLYAALADAPLPLWMAGDEGHSSEQSEHKASEDSTEDEDL
jgi:hypothetical protein